MCISRREIQTVELVLCSIYTVPMNTKCICMYKLGNMNCVNFGGSTYDLNAFIFAFINGIAQNKDEW